MDDPDRLRGEIADAETVVALTGAGISQPSGVPTFREEGGVWDRFEQRDFAYSRFQRNPAGFWEDRLELQRALFGGDYEPNAAHETLARMGREGTLEAVVTQNTDGLHRRANREIGDDDGNRADDHGSRVGAVGDDRDGVADDETDPLEVIELHGNAHRVRCVDCDGTYDAGPVFERAADGELPPTCGCGGVLEPDVVLFGQQLPGAALQRARNLARESDVSLAVGSSLVVEPAASLPRRAARTGATVAVVNLEETPCDDVADYVIRGDVTEVVPRLRPARRSE